MLFNRGLSRAPSFLLYVNELQNRFFFLLICQALSISTDSFSKGWGFSHVTKSVEKFKFSDLAQYFGAELVHKISNSLLRERIL